MIEMKKYYMSTNISKFEEILLNSKMKFQELNGYRVKSTIMANIPVMAH